MLHNFILHLIPLHPGVASEAYQSLSSGIPLADLFYATPLPSHPSLLLPIASEPLLLLVHFYQLRWLVGFLPVLLVILQS